MLLLVNTKDRNKQLRKYYGRADELAELSMMLFYFRDYAGSYNNCSNYLVKILLLIDFSRFETNHN